MATLRTVKGMHDILPAESPRWRFVEEVFRDLAERFGYGEIRTPVLEPLDLFVRGIGEATDIVEKEMYTFEDKGGDWLAMRPEGTASAIRSYLQHNLSSRETFSKLYYIGPMFRRERPAKGRFRQFHQAGAELVGVSDPAADAEIILMAVLFLEEIGIENVSVQLNSLGDTGTRTDYRNALVAFFSEKGDSLCEDCRRRLRTNPLRVLDCKVEGCRAVSADAPSVLGFLSDPSREHFEELKRLLDRAGATYEIVPTMVRGLDYYTRTIFEIQGDAGSLGAQSALVGGGRYDDLVEELGGRSTPAIGFSFGIERLLMILGEGARAAARSVVFIAGVGEGGLDRAIDIGRELRRAGHRVEIPYREASLRSQLKRADRLSAEIAIIAGEDEAARGAVTWRNMKDGSQEEIPLSDIAERLGALR